MRAVLNFINTRTQAAIRAAHLAIIGDDFRAMALEYFGRNDMRGQSQRIDGIHCFSPMGNVPFFGFRLALMAKMGDLRTFKGNGIWASTRNMPYYGLPKTE